MIKRKQSLVVVHGNTVPIATAALVPQVVARVVKKAAAAVDQGVAQVEVGVAVVLGAVAVGVREVAPTAVIKRRRGRVAHLQRNQKRNDDLLNLFVASFS